MAPIAAATAQQPAVSTQQPAVSTQQPTASSRQPTYSATARQFAAQRNSAAIQSADNSTDGLATAVFALLDVDKSEAISIQEISDKLGHDLRDREALQQLFPDLMSGKHSDLFLIAAGDPQHPDQVRVSADDWSIYWQLIEPSLRRSKLEELLQLVVSQRASAASEETRVLENLQMRYPAATEPQIGRALATSKGHGGRACRWLGQVVGLTPSIQPNTRVCNQSQPDLGWGRDHSIAADSLRRQQQDAYTRSPPPLAASTGGWFKGEPGQGHTNRVPPPGVDLLQPTEAPASGQLVDSKSGWFRGEAAAHHGWSDGDFDDDFDWSREEAAQVPQRGRSSASISAPWGSSGKKPNEETRREQPWFDGQSESLQCGLCTICVEPVMDNQPRLMDGHDGCVHQSCKDSIDGRLAALPTAVMEELRKETSLHILAQKLKDFETRWFRGSVQQPATTHVKPHVQEPPWFRPVRAGLRPGFKPRRSSLEFNDY